MDVVGSEIGQKMRSAIKAKLTELGCYVDDELPDYVMVMVANKRTRTQMEDDLQLFLVDNTKLFVNWLHQVLKKLQEVTVTAPIILPETEPGKDILLLKDHKSKDKKSKDKSKKSDIKKAKKKEKEKQHRKRDERKVHKSKKKSKHHEMIHPNVPPLLMNMEKESEPSITDVFAGQILKRHGFTVDETKDSPKPIEKKPVITEAKKPIHPIIDPATIPSQSEPILVDDNKNAMDNVDKISVATVDINRDEQIKEMNAIEAKIQGLKQKLSQQLDSMSEDDEDFLNIRTEADELMNDFAEDVFQEISQPTPATPPIVPKSPIVPPARSITPVKAPNTISQEPVDTLPQIELKLPKRSLRERPEEHNMAVDGKVSGKKDKRTKSPERFTPDRAPIVPSQPISIKSRLGNQREKKNSTSDDKYSNKTEFASKKLNSRVSVLENRSSRSSCTSVVRVRPRPRVQTTASSLLMKAMADAHKSLLNIPPKVDHETHVKRALVLPMRRTVDAQKIVIQVPVGNTSPADENDADRLGDDSISLGEMDSDDDRSFKEPSRTGKEEYVPTSITKKITNNEYIPSKRNEGRKASRKDDTLIIETINIHNPTVDKDKSTQFIVTMDGYHPNAFLAKKLLNEGILNTDDEITQPKETKDKAEEKINDITPTTINNTAEKPSSNTSDESATEVVIKKEIDTTNNYEEHLKVVVKVEENPIPPVRKRKASPIIFDILKKEKEEERVRTESVSSDSHVIITTNPNTHKYDSVPPLSQAERKPTWCRAFPLCRYGSACAFLHPRCKFAAACTRRDCVYSHGLASTNAPPTPVALAPILASHVVPAANYKTISSAGIPGMCKYYPSCANPACHFYHPKPCRYGKSCTNKLECNFYHIDVPSKWKVPF